MKRASVCFSSGVAGRCSCSMVWTVRMAATMSWALVFSPLAMGEAGDGCSEREVGGSGDLTASVRAEVVTAGGDVSFATWDSGSLSVEAGSRRLLVSSRRSPAVVVKCRKTFAAPLDRAAVDLRSGRRTADPRKAWRVLSTGSRMARDSHCSLLPRSPPPPDGCAG